MSNRHGISVANSPRGLWVWRRSASPFTGASFWWRWIRIWPLPPVVKRRPRIGL